jgi:hypothetical protein
VDPTPGPDAARVRAAWLLAPALLVLVALAQITLAFALDLSPWLGGGFGMFATIESRSERHLVAFADSPGLMRELAIPERLEDAAARVRALPTRDRLRELAARIAAAERERVPGIQGVRLQLWRTRYAPGTLAPDDRLAGEVTAGLDEDG